MPIIVAWTSITAHKSLMRCEEGVEHCVLFLGEGSQDGVLVNSEGYDWARYGKKYCHNSPTLDEAPLQQAILAALNTAMADKNSLIRQITAAMETELIPFPGGTMSLGDIECRLRVLEQQFQTLLEKATDDPAAYGGQFKEILDEQTFLKEKRSGILANNNEQAKANQRIMDAAQTLENASPYITEWDESAVRQLVETVKILSKDEVAVTLKGGIEICQKIMY